MRSWPASGQTASRLAARRSSLAAVEPEPGDGDGPPRRTATVEEAGYDRAEEATTIDALLDQLPPRDRVVVELRFRHELLQREIGELLGISQMQVSRILARSIATLHELADAPAGPAAAT